MKPDIKWMRWSMAALLVVLAIWFAIDTDILSVKLISLSNQTNHSLKTVGKDSVMKISTVDSVPIYPPYTSKHSLSKPVLYAPGVISTGDDEAHATFTPDGKTLYFIKNTPNFSHWTIVISEFKNGHWSTPEVAPFSGRYNDADVSFSQDGRTLFFVSNRPVEDGEKPKEDTDIWMMHKIRNGWSKPERITALSSPGYEWFPTVSNDGTIYFGSERRDRNYGPKGTSDLWRAELVDGRYTEPENLGNVINTAGQDIEAYIVPDESFIIFASNGREDTYGSYDLYISYNQNGTWSEPQNLGKPINSESWDFGAKLSPDENYLFFTSNRSYFGEPLKERLNYKELTEKIRSPGNGLRDIYQVDASVLPPPPEMP